MQFTTATTLVAGLEDARRAAPGRETARAGEAKAADRRRTRLSAAGARRSVSVLSAGRPALRIPVPCLPHLTAALPMGTVFADPMVATAIPRYP